MNTVQDDAIAPAIRQEIDARLTAIEDEHDVRLLLAAESGSRAWGFPSPDSAYDVRFISVRRRDWYLSLTPGRDVIETPIEDGIDLNGWDIQGARAAAQVERGGQRVDRLADPLPPRPRRRVRAGGTRRWVLDPRALAHHYASLGRNAADRWLAGDEAVPVKKYFYALRPALAIRCLRERPGERPPMNLQALIAAVELPQSLAVQLDDLVEAKRRTNERANGTRLPDLDALIRDELARASEVRATTPDPQLQAEAERLFLELVNT